ncbi:PPOX class F420-dependent oxidoreductase [Mycetocola zhadangensis]|uniref:PPOX class F420-dependent oxidoreductase n=1 Tax=Mycetocola zhadangensis TaxID=1164595 RepID=A0A3L7JC60_9MICO|nr:PPOX class F420-dependent oxidoreductase [Mycetocola zhadangensis]RLQ86082.1 PPOX class F420-dependent oxidoreductase [Mycetocola zhadangensis]GGE88234.1 hypothetical protein GCM10011313_08620 [Mycetocola zhadangensis]
MTGSALTALSVEPYILLTTFRASGAPVSTPVWVAGGLGGLLVTTSGASGKVKRIRRNSSVELTACDRTGTVSERATIVRATGFVVDDPESRQIIEEALERKYGDRYRAVRAARRRPLSESVVIRILPGDEGTPAPSQQRDLRENESSE